MFTIVLFPQIQLLFPEEGLVYDYKLNDAGLNNAEDDLDEDVIREVKYFTSNSKLGNLRNLEITQSCRIWQNLLIKGK